MAKFKLKNAAEKSLLNDITLMYRMYDDSSAWAEFDEIQKYIDKGFTIFNDEKRIAWYNNEKSMSN